MCDEYSMHISFKTQSVLCQALLCNSLDRHIKEGLKSDLINCYKLSFDKQIFSAAVVLSSLFTIYGQVPITSMV